MCSSVALQNSRTIFGTVTSSAGTQPNTYLFIYFFCIYSVFALSINCLKKVLKLMNAFLYTLQFTPA